MATPSFFKKHLSRTLWGNCLGMVVFVIVVVVATLLALRSYTHHGQSIAVPDVTHQSMYEARRVLKGAALSVVVGDTGYVKDLPRDCVLEQKPAAGTRVKPGHVVALIVNASSTPTLALPDIIQNCSLREAVARLRAMGFKVGDTQYVRGERDWVYGVTVNGRPRGTGDRISINDVVVVQAGDGFLDEEDSVVFVEAVSAADEPLPAADDNGEGRGDYMEVPQ